MRRVVRVTQMDAEFGSTLTATFEEGGLLYAVGGISPGATHDEIQARIDGIVRLPQPLASNDRPDLVAGRSAAIDAQADAAIGAALHPVAPRGEEAAIHREQLQAILAELGMKPTEKFARLVEIAQKAVAAGKEAKAG